MKQKYKNLIKAITFPLLVFLIILGLGKFFLPYWTSTYSAPNLTITDFYDEPEDSIDVLFLGSCNVYNSVNPITLWNDYGITSFSFATPHQEMAVSYHYLIEALKTQKPKVVVLDALMLSDQYVATETMIRESVDYLPFSLNKLNLINAVSTEKTLDEFLSYLLPVFRYHERWSEINPDDFGYHSDNFSNSFKGFLPIFEDVEVTVDTNNMVKIYNENIGLKEDGIDYLKQIISLCEKEKIQFSLIKTPTVGYWNYQNHINVQNLAETLGIEFIDFNLLLDDMEIDMAQDSMSSTAERLNYAGSEKYMSYLGKMLIDKYEVQSRKDDPIIAEDWEKEAKRYELYRNMFTLSQTENLDAFLQTYSAIKDDCILFFGAIDLNTALSLIPDHQNIGLQPVVGTGNYFAIIDDNVPIYSAFQTQEISYTNLPDYNLSIEMSGASWSTKFSINNKDYTLYYPFGFIVYDKTRNIVIDSVFFNVELQAVR